jgi:5'(3')-deoxyribonucleotidase
MRIFIDLDETLVNLVDPWIAELNKMSGKDLARDQIGCYSVDKNYRDKLSRDEIFLPFRTEGFWEGLPPFPGAIQFVQSLYFHEFDIYIATIPSLGPVCHREKEQWVINHLPFIGRKRLIFCHHKFVLRGDALLDDNPRYLSNFQGRRLLFDRPWNQEGELRKQAMEESWFIRVHSYQEAFNYLMQMELSF